MLQIAIPLPLLPMRKIGYCILITLFLFLHAQSLFASVSVQASCSHSFEYFTPCAAALTGFSGTSETTLQSDIGEDNILSDIVDNDTDISLTVRKKGSAGKIVCCKHAQGVYRQRYANALCKQRFPFSPHLSSPLFIFLRAIRI